MGFERLAVLGAGAIGSTIGAHLTRAGRDVTLIDFWPAHVEAMQQGGLKVSAQDEEFTVKVAAIHLADVCTLRQPFDAVFLAVKSYDTAWAVPFIEPHLAPAGVLPAMPGQDGHAGQPFPHGHRDAPPPLAEFLRLRRDPQLPLGERPRVRRGPGPAAADALPHERQLDGGQADAGGKKGLTFFSGSCLGIGSQVFSFSEEGSMKNHLGGIALLGVHFLSSGLNGYRPLQEIDIKITPDQDSYVAGVDNPPPVFRISTRPNSLVCIELAINKKTFNGIDRVDGLNFFSSLFGDVEVKGEEIMTDDEGNAEYKIPRALGQPRVGRHV